MKELKEVFERSGMEGVITYINSGNVIFNDPDHSKAEIEALLEKAIEDSFSLDIKVLILSLDHYHEVMKELPDYWKNDKEMKSDVLFLWEEFDRETVINDLTIKSNIDQVRYVPGALLWSVEKKNLTKSGLMKLAGTKLYKKMTIRNVNTTRKIYEIMISMM